MPHNCSSLLHIPKVVLLPFPIPLSSLLVITVPPAPPLPLNPHERTNFAGHLVNNPKENAQKCVKSLEANIDD